MRIGFMSSLIAIIMLSAFTIIKLGERSANGEPDEADGPAQRSAWMETMLAPIEHFFGEREIAEKKAELEQRKAIADRRPSTVREGDGIVRCRAASGSEVYVREQTCVQRGGMVLD